MEGCKNGERFFSLVVFKGRKAQFQFEESWVLCNKANLDFAKHRL